MRNENEKTQQDIKPIEKTGFISEVSGQFNEKNDYEFKTGDLITLVSDDVVRVVRFERDGKVCSDWIDSNGQPQRINVEKEDVKLLITP